MSFICINEIRPNGNLRGFEVLTPSDCVGFLAQNALDFNSITLFDLFTIPLATDLNQMFMLGMFIPLLSYIVSATFGVLINWFSNPDHDR